MTPTTEVRYGEPVDLPCKDCRCGWCGAWWSEIGDVTEPCAMGYQGYIGPHQRKCDCERRVRFAYTDCPEGCEYGWHRPKKPLGRLDPGDPCLTCNPSPTLSDRWGIPRGTVRVECGTCIHGLYTPPLAGPERPCPEIAAGRCYEGYAVEVAPLKLLILVVAIALGAVIGTALRVVLRRAP